MVPRPYCRLKDFVEDLYALRSEGYTTKQNYIDRLQISAACFDRRLVRARKAGLLPQAQRRSRTFNLFGEHNV